MATIGTVAINVVANTAPFAAGMGQSAAMLGSFARQSVGVASVLTGLQSTLFGVAGGAMAAAFAFQMLGGGAAEFSLQMAQSTAIMPGLTADLRQQLEATAKSVALTTKWSASQSAEAYRFLASAGYDAEQSMAALPLVAKFAQAGLFDLNQATTLLVDTQKAMGLASADPIKNMRELEHVANVVTKANILANASVEDFAIALTNKSAKAAQVLGVELEEVTAVLAAFAEQGVKGEEAGTAVQVVLRELSRGAIKNAEGFRQMGVEVFDAQGKFNNMADIVRDLEVALAGLSPEGRTAALMELGIPWKSISAIQQLIGTSESIRRFEKELHDVGGLVDQVAADNIPALQRALQRLKAGFGNLAINTIMGPLNAFGTVILALTDNLGRAEDSFGVVAAQVTVFSASFIAALIIIPKIVAGILAIVRVLRALAVGQAIATALSGPKGWAILAASVAAAAVATHQVNKAFTQVEMAAASAAEVANDAAEKAQQSWEDAEEGPEAFANKVDESADKLAKLRDEAKQVADSVRTPFEIAADSLGHLEMLFKSGVLGVEDYTRAVEKTKKELLEAVQQAQQLDDVQSRPIGAVTRGSSQGFSAVQESRREMERIAKHNADLVRLQKEANAKLQELINQGRGAQPVEIGVASI